MLDRDQSTLSQSYAWTIGGSRYFVERPPILGYLRGMGPAHARRRTGAGHRDPARFRVRSLARGRSAPGWRDVDGEGHYSVVRAEWLTGARGRRASGWDHRDPATEYNPMGTNPACRDGAGGDAAAADDASRHADGLFVVRERNWVRSSTFIPSRVDRGGIPAGQRRRTWPLAPRIF